jgi:hypothetical protein
MNHIEHTQASLAEIAKRRNQVIEGASRGRHRGWDAAGMLAIVAAAMWLFDQTDLPLRNTLAGVLLAALVATGDPLYRALMRRAAA